MIKVIWILLILNSGNLKSPKDFVWKNRILIIQNTSSDSTWFHENLKQDLEDRKLLIFEFNKEVLVQSNCEELIDPSKFFDLLPKNNQKKNQWVLIGLDGGVKKSGFEKPIPTDLFKVIDAMPMRQSEIRKSEI